MKKRMWDRFFFFIKSLRVDDHVGRCALDPAGRPEGRCRGKRIRPLDVPHSPRSCATRGFDKGTKKKQKIRLKLSNYRSYSEQEQQQKKSRYEFYLLGMNVDFGGFAGRILDDEEHFGDELDDVARLQNQVTFPLAAKRRRHGRRRLGLEM